MKYKKNKYKRIEINSVYKWLKWNKKENRWFLEKDEEIVKVLENKYQNLFSEKGVKIICFCNEEGIM